MAGKLKTAEEWEAWDKERTRQAMREVEASENLRFLFRSLLAAYGVNSTPFSSDPILTARLCGRHEAGMDIIATMLEHCPSLYPKLIVEDTNEQALRPSVE